MKVNQLIEQLNNIQLEKGNAEVIICNTEEGYNSYQKYFTVDCVKNQTGKTEDEQFVILINL